MRNMQTEVSQLKVLSYLVEQLDEYTEVILERRPQEDGSERWAIYKGRFCLGKTEARWGFEPSPSNRDAGFIAEYRWDSAEEAYAFWKQNRDAIVNRKKRGKNV